MIVGNRYGSGCIGKGGKHVVVDYGDMLWCAVCDNCFPPDGDLWWRYAPKELPADYMEITG